MNVKSTRRLTAKEVEVLGQRVIHPKGEPTDLEADANRCAIS